MAGAASADPAIPRPAALRNWRRFMWSSLSVLRSCLFDPAGMAPAAKTSSYSRAKKRRTRSSRQPSRPVSKLQVVRYVSGQRLGERSLAGVLGLSQANIVCRRTTTSHSCRSRLRVTGDSWEERALPRLPPLRLRCLRNAHVGTGHAPDLGDGVVWQVDRSMGLADRLLIRPGHEAEGLAVLQIHMCGVTKTPNCAAASSSAANWSKNCCSVSSCCRKLPLFLSWASMKYFMLVLLLG